MRGHPVTSADLPGQVRITAPDEITISITVDLLRQFGAQSDSPLAARGEASVGTVTYDIAAGRLTYNGQPLSDHEEQALAAACAGAVPKK